jgi:hypothetical protein
LGYGLDVQRLISGKGIFVLRRYVQISSEVHSALYPIKNMAISSKAKRPNDEADLSIYQKQTFSCACREGIKGSGGGDPFIFQFCTIQR